MKKLIALVLAASLLGGCAVYASPNSFGASVGVFAPTPVGPAYHYRGWRQGYPDRYDGWRRG